MACDSSTGGCEVVLASASPRRAALLKQIGVPFRTLVADVEEQPLAGESPEDFVLRMARDKTLAVAGLTDARPVIGADTAVVLDGRIFGKPADREAAISMLGALSGRTHTVFSAVAVYGHALNTLLSVSRVTFRDIPSAEREAYWDTGEPCDKAGAYAIQGYGAIFIVNLAGSYSGVMGLPLFETAQLLAQAGHTCWRSQGG